LKAKNGEIVILQGFTVTKTCKDSEKEMYFRENYVEKQEDSYRKYSGNYCINWFF